jgi:hypothetical protein
VLIAACATRSRRSAGGANEAVAGAGRHHRRVDVPAGGDGNGFLFLVRCGESIFGRAQASMCFVPIVCLVVATSGKALVLLKAKARARFFARAGLTQISGLGP